MATELKEYISKCDVCLAHRSTPGKEPLLSHELVARPWSKVAADLCELDGHTLLVIADYYSNFIEVARLNSVTSRSVIKEMKDVFARHGIPDVLVTDNGTQFASAEFAVFAETWSFEHHTSSPRYPQSNGNAENAVQIVKRLFTKCKASGQSEYLALLDWRNTPTEGCWNESSTTPFRSPLQDLVAGVWYAASTLTLNRRRNESYNGYEASATAFLRQAH